MRKATTPPPRPPTKALPPQVISPPTSITISAPPNKSSANPAKPSSGCGAPSTSSPACPRPTQSLTFLRTRLAFFEFAGTWLDRTIAALPATFGRWASSLALWGGLLALAGAFVLPRLRPNRSAFITLGLVLLMASFVFSRVGRYREQRLSPSTFAIVTGESVSALTAPTSDAKPVVALPPGSELRLLRVTGPWTYAEIPGELRGWVRTESIRPVWPIPSKNPS
jgi:hypothetical protein